MLPGSNTATWISTAELLEYQDISALLPLRQRRRLKLLLLLLLLLPTATHYLPSTSIMIFSLFNISHHQQS